MDVAILLQCLQANVSRIICAPALIIAHFGCPAYQILVGVDTK